MLPSPHPASLGGYRLLRRIGIGGMAEVYEAVRGDGTAPRVALKVLLPHLREDEHIVTSFIDEAQICAELSHPNIVAVYDFGQMEGIYYMAMEFVDGIDLRELLQRQEDLGKRLPMAACAYVGHELATGLHYIHTRERRIVHRDVTPHNVFLTRGGDIKLADFGVAKAKARLTRTETGRIKGKLAYLAPEQVRGDPVSPRTDVFALGLLLYEMATGERANRGDNDVALLEQAMNPRPRKPSQRVPEAQPLDRVVSHALARHPAMRTRDAALVADQLEELLRRQPFDATNLESYLAELEGTLAAEEASLREADTQATLDGHLTPRATAKTPRDPAASAKALPVKAHPTGSALRWKTSPTVLEGVDVAAAGADLKLLPTPIGEPGDLGWVSSATTDQNTGFDDEETQVAPPAGMLDFGWEPDEGAAEQPAGPEAFERIDSLSSAEMEIPTRVRKHPGWEEAARRPPQDRDETRRRGPVGPRHRSPSSGVPRADGPRAAAAAGGRPPAGPTGPLFVVGDAPSAGSPPPTPPTPPAPPVKLPAAIYGSDSGDHAFQEDQATLQRQRNRGPQRSPGRHLGSSPFSDAAAVGQPLGRPVESTDEVISLVHLGETERRVASGTLMSPPRRRRRPLWLGLALVLAAGGVVAVGWRWLGWFG